MNFVTKAMLAPAALLAMPAAAPAFAQEVVVEEPYAYGDDAGVDDEDVDDEALDDGVIDDEDDVAAATEDGLDGGAERCADEFRSFEPESGTYLGHDGARRPCPYL